MVVEKIFVHGKEISYNPDFEYGFYFSDVVGFQNYVVVGIKETEKLLNGMSIEKILVQADYLKKMQKFK